MWPKLQQMLRDRRRQAPFFYLKTKSFPINSVTERMIRKFLWNIVNGQRKEHLVWNPYLPGDYCIR